MATPPPPMWSSDNNPRTTKNISEQAARTPYQTANSYQRCFRSEVQLNKIFNRLQTDNKSLRNGGTSYYPSTSQRQTTRLNCETTSVKGPLVSRLCNVIKPAQQLTKPPEVKPAPLSSNRPNLHLTRAHSETSIKYQIHVNDKVYKILRKIGSGGSAKVYEGFESQTSQNVAVKIINVAQADPRTRESYFNEKSILSKLRDNRHVVKMYDSEYKTDLKELIIVMEKGDADLSQVIESHFKVRNTMIDGIFIKFYWRGMLEAVNSIHQQGVVHADLKPVNFILVKNEIKLIDFGIATALAPQGTSVIRDFQIGTINYMAPEALTNRATELSFHNSKSNVDENNQQRKTVIKYNSKADIWSLGCILYNLVYGRPPFDKYKDIVSKSHAITNPNQNINFPEISNQKLLDCMRLCLKFNPADRPSARELLNHPYLQEDMVRLKHA